MNQPTNEFWIIFLWCLMLWMGMFFLCKETEDFRTFHNCWPLGFFQPPWIFEGDPGFPPSHLLSYVDIFHTDQISVWLSQVPSTSINFHQLPKSPPRWYATLDLLTGIKNSKTESITQEGDDFYRLLIGGAFGEDENHGGSVWGKPAWF